jgi:hypothetical protein
MVELMDSTMVVERAVWKVSHMESLRVQPMVIYLDVAWDKPLVDLMVCMMAEKKAFLKDDP